ncbi:unnamed protein product [Symbiodinium sp. CCMP2456]|nr:unnamed protein product [Symbiodinium sp. CCMP2456]
MAAAAASTPTGMDDFEAILDRMEHQAATLGCFPPPSPLLGPTPDTCMELLQGLRGPELGKGMTCTEIFPWQATNDDGYLVAEHPPPPPPLPAEDSDTTEGPGTTYG